VAESDLVRSAQEQGLPGRLIGEEWRFLKSALQEWLGAPTTTKPSKQAVLSRIGKWKGDSYLGQELEETYQRRGRPMIEDAS
jgi:hypothetical protein